MQGQEKTRLCCLRSPSVSVPYLYLIARPGKPLALPQWLVPQGKPSKARSGLAHTDGQPAARHSPVAVGTAGAAAVTASPAVDPTVPSPPPNSPPTAPLGSGQLGASPEGPHFAVAGPSSANKAAALERAAPPAAGASTLEETAGPAGGAGAASGQCRLDAAPVSPGKVVAVPMATVAPDAAAAMGPILTPAAEIRAGSAVAVAVAVAVAAAVAGPDSAGAGAPGAGAAAKAADSALPVGLDSVASPAKLPRILAAVATASGASGSAAVEAAVRGSGAPGAGGTADARGAGGAHGSEQRSLPQGRAIPMRDGEQPGVPQERPARPPQVAFLVPYLSCPPFNAGYSRMSRAFPLLL
jgi:hypothetical protein